MKLGARKVAVVILVCMLIGGIVLAISISARPNKPAGRLTGTITLYPIGPVCVQINQCSRPASGQLVEVHRLNGTLIAKTNTDEQGVYRFRLPAGYYNLAVPAGRYGRGASNIANPINLKDGTTLNVNVTIDTGIR